MNMYFERNVGKVWESTPVFFGGFFVLILLLRFNYLKELTKSLESASVFVHFKHTPVGVIGHILAAEEKT